MDGSTLNTIFNLHFKIGNDLANKTNFLFCWNPYLEDIAPVNIYWRLKPTSNRKKNNNLKIKICSLKKTWAFHCMWQGKPKCNLGRWRWCWCCGECVGRVFSWEGERDEEGGEREREETVDEVTGNSEWRER